MRKGSTVPPEQRRKISAGVKARNAAKRAADGAANDEADRIAQGEPAGRRPDPPPEVPGAEAKREKAKAGARKRDKPTDADLRSTLARMLSMPAIPAKMVLHCDFCAAHFATEGPRTAAELVELSKDHPDLRAALEDFHRAYTSVTWAGILLGYVAKPLAHHLAPNAILEATYPVMEVPPRPAPSMNGHAHGPTPPPPGATPPPAPDPMAAMFSPEAMQAAQAMVDQMDPAELDNLARTFGLDGMMEDHGTTTPPTDPLPADNAELDPELDFAAEAETEPDEIAGFEGA